MERNTKQKEILIKYLNQNSNKHLTIKEIQNDLKDKLGLTTIYRIINNLIEDGMVTKMPFENKQGCCYKYNNKSNTCDNHYHLICEKCNKLIHYESNEIQKIEEQIKTNENFVVDNTRVVFYGICKDCQYNKKVNEMGGNKNE